MKPHLFAGACLGALLCCPLAVGAQQASAPRPLIGGHGNNVGAFISQHDDNADGKLIWEEFDAFRRKRFDATDENGDGIVDVEEYVQEFDDRSRAALEDGRARQMEQAGQRFAALDADRDGRVSRAEFDAAGERQFAGFLKMPAGKEADAAARFDRRDGLSLPSGHTREGFLELFDGNGDGQVGRAEFDQARAARFAHTDGDRDGVLSEDEYLAEYEDRLDRRIATLGQGADEQTRVRFGALDADKDGRLTFAEYQVSGRRTFDNADRNRDGLVDAVDAKLPPPPRPQRPAPPAAAARSDTGN